MLLAGCTAESSVDDELLEDISETPDTNEESDPGSAPEEIIEVGESGYLSLIHISEPTRPD